MSKKVAIVTGSNKGIGYAIVKGLCEKFDGTVYLTSRDEQRGKEAVRKLEELGFKPAYHQLDVDNKKSVEDFRDYLKNNHGGIDLLVNNAAIAFNHDATETLGYQAEHTIKTNYFSLNTTCDILFPLLRNDARVVNISSSAGHLSKIPSEKLRARFSNPELTVDELNTLMNEFIAVAKDCKNAEHGWGGSTYTVSKVGVSALTRIQQRIADKEEPYRNLYINCVHPGYVVTDMTNQKGLLNTDEGAVAPLFLSLEPHGWKGQYVWRDCTICDWLAEETPAVV